MSELSEKPLSELNEDYLYNARQMVGMYKNYLKDLNLSTTECRNVLADVQVFAEVSIAISLKRIADALESKSTETVMGEIFEGNL